MDVLKLLRETYCGKIKLIYIDPPYNTGSDFVYRDDFSVSFSEYEHLSGEVDENQNRLVANPTSNGRFHSDWCSMIYPRIYLARDLLEVDGIILISIDDNEIDNLTKICKEIFGEENHLATLIWDLGTGTSAGHFTRGHEYIVVFVKDRSKLSNFKNYIDDEIITHSALKKISKKNPPVEITFPAGFEFEGNSAVFKGEIGLNEKELILSEEMRFENGKLVAPVTISAGFAMRNQIESYIAGHEVLDSKGQRVKRFYFNSKGILWYEKEKTIINPSSVLRDIANTKNGTSDLESLFGNKVFDYPKPVALLDYLLRLMTGPEDTILDFFSGSATVAQAVFAVNTKDAGKRNFILVQYPEELPEDSEGRKLGYKTICDVGLDRIRKSGESVKGEMTDNSDNLDIGFRVFSIDSSNMRNVF